MSITFLTGDERNGEKIFLGYTSEHLFTVVLIMAFNLPSVESSFFMCQTRTA